jgi:hypothetical protein
MKNGWIAAIGMAVLTVGSTAWAQVPPPTIPKPGPAPTIPGIRPTIPPSSTPGPGVVIWPPVVLNLIPCPLVTVVTQITTPIPAPWWQTPHQGRLQNRRIDIVGGKKTLICEYNAGRNRVWDVMRLYPEGTTECVLGLEGIGFSCH